MMAFNGVRSSWLIDARKDDLVLLASAATYSAVVRSWLVFFSACWVFFQLGDVIAHAQRFALRAPPDDGR